MKNPDHIEAFLAQGKQLHRQGKLSEARGLYEQALAMDRENSDALHLLGVIANQQGEHDKAAELIAKAISIKPEARNFHGNLGLALMALGDFQNAREQFTVELTLHPDNSASWANMGALCMKTSRPAEAVDHYQRALALQPDDVMTLNDLAFAYFSLYRFEEARETAGRSLQLESRNPDAFNLLGLVDRLQGMPEQAVSHYSEALHLRPGAAEIYMNRGVAYRDLGQFERALQDFDQALKLRPDYPDPHYSKARLLLAKGNFREGWREYDYGLKCGERVPVCRSYPMWQGEPLDNRTILICAEQGLGDEIMFASILPEIIKEAGHCILECDAKLMPIYRRSFSAASLLRRSKVGESTMSGNLPQIDFQVPVGSLPRYRRNQLADFPSHSGYLKADQERIGFWKARLDKLGPGLKVGISWRGGLPKTGEDRRSIPLENWMPVLEREGVQFISLQYTDCEAEIRELERSRGIRVVHWQEAIDDYDETAALVCALDLIITVQTAVFHLGGALGCKVWGLIALPAEWRYMAEGQTLPWYPSARLFRQETRGEWPAVLRGVGQELGQLVALHAQSR